MTALKMPPNDGARNLTLMPSGEPTMSSREIGDLLDTRHDSVKRTIERLADKGVILRPPLVDEQFPDALGRSRIEQVYYVGKRDSYVIVAQLSPEFTARLVDRWQELEAARPALPNFADAAAAARAWADEHEARVLAERTKAQIGARREATAMATASTAVRKANRLELALDRAASFATVKRMEALHPGRHFNWRVLKRVSVEVGIAPLDTFDQNYGTVKAYPAAAWKRAYGLDVPAPAGGIS